MIDKILEFWKNYVVVVAIGSCLLIVVGFYLMHYAWTYAPAHPVNSMYMLTGMIMFCGGGFILFLTIIFWWIWCIK